jgi:hypothetical protein
MLEVASEISVGRMHVASSEKLKCFRELGAPSDAVKRFGRGGLIAL